MELRPWVESVKYLWWNDITRLDGHVIKRRSDCPGPHRSGIPTSNCHWRGKLFSFWDWLRGEQIYIPSVAWAYGKPTIKEVIAKRAHCAPANLSGKVSRATSNGSDQIWLTSPMKNRWLNFSENHVQKSSWRIKRTLEGMTSRLVSNTLKPRDRRVRVK